MAKVSDPIDRALEMAARAHEGQMRKGTRTPYITHPVAVAILLAKAGCSDDVITAGILHDVVEDTHVTIEEIREVFGERVASIVEGCSEPDKSLPWEERKQHTLRYLPTAPWEVRLVACTDKLHNLSTIAEDLDRVGEGVWTRFKRGREEQEWYYRSLVRALCGPPHYGTGIPFCDDFRALVDKVFGREPQSARRES